MSEHIRLIKLNNGVAMPALGLGVYQSPAEQTAEAVATAIGQGYRLIDTAAAYFNERQVGEGIRQSRVARSELFVTTKLWISDYGRDAALRAFDKSMGKLGLDYLDLYLLHWPVPSDFEKTVASYQAAEQLLAEGRVRAIGVSNFGSGHLANLIERAEVVPHVNQVELHPFLNQGKLRETHERFHIVTQAWSPIGGVNRYLADAGKAHKDPLIDPTIVAIALKHGKTPAQIVLRWHIQHGISAIPKSVCPERIAQNVNIFDFALTPEEVSLIDALDTGQRGGPDPEQVSMSLFNLTIDD